MNLVLVGPTAFTFVGNGTTQLRGHCSAYRVWIGALERDDRLVNECATRVGCHLASTTGSAGRESREPEALVVVSQFVACDRAGIERRLTRRGCVPGLGCTVDLLVVVALGVILGFEVFDVVGHRNFVPTRHQHKTSATGASPSPSTRTGTCA